MIDTSCQVRIKKKTIMLNALIKHLLGTHNCCEHGGKRQQRYNTQSLLSRDMSSTESLAQGKNIRFSTIRTKKDTEKGEREKETGESENVTWKPFDCVLDLNGEEKVHFTRGKGSSMG